MDERYDLTTRAGLRKAAEALSAIATPQWSTALVKQFGDWLSRKPVDQIESQRDAALAIIKAGREQGAKQLKVTLDQSIGLDVTTKLGNQPYKVSLGKSGSMTIEVIYDR
ncbi:hypothetical protein [Ralstonia pseudosolanacearum]